MSTEPPLWVPRDDRPHRVYDIDKREVVDLLKQEGGEARIHTLRRASRFNEARVRAALETLHEEGRVEITEVRHDRVRCVGLAE